MKISYRFLSLFAFIVFLSSLVLAQNELTREQMELQSAFETQLKAEQQKLDPKLTEGTGILLVQDILIPTDTVEAMLVLLGIPYTRILNSQFIDTTVTAWLGYDAVIWTGTTSVGAELDSTTAYLAAGGNLIVWENDEAYFFGGRTGPATPLFANYFQAQYVSDDGSDGVITGTDIMSGISFDISSDPYPDDVVITGANAVGTFLAPGDTTFAALRAGDGTYRAGLMLWDAQFGNFDSNTVVLDRIVDFVAYGIIPVELTSFVANVNDNIVNLVWKTASETNNSGFEIQRKSANGKWNNIGFVVGFGTTTEPKAYSFTDNNVAVGSYSYRLKQIDFNGMYEFSNEINVDVTAPLQFSLEQNYPNPFNPSTLIKYSVAKDGFVNVSVFNLIGEKVATLVNGNVKAGSYEVNFNASSLSSGIYFYSIEASNFKAVRKMLLMK